ncbi:hypothetical protein ERO13_D09G038250v2 [Gossypium hirsutum]|nr:hypothetical protein ERO13_D09G038250v2 [Gossypium hirsutum]
MDSAHHPLLRHQENPKPYIKYKVLKEKLDKEREMMVLFILLSPGMMFQLPTRTRVIEFGNMCTSGIAILVHAIIYFSLFTILIMAIGIHIHVY